MPKRLRYHPERDPAIQNAALHIFLNAIQKDPRQCSPGASAASHIGAVVFIHRFGALRNTHLHFHCIVIDGVFDTVANGGVAFLAGSMRAAGRGYPCSGDDWRESIGRDPDRVGTSPGNSLRLAASAGAHLRSAAPTVSQVRW